MATTDALGEWRIQTQPTRIGPREVRRMDAPRAMVVVEGGRLRLRIAGRDLAGRGGGTQGFLAGPNPVAGRLQGGPDTLTFSRGGKVLLRDTVSASRSGIVRILDSTFNPAIVYGHLTDSRDGQIYRTVMIGSQVWMAENLNYRKGPGTDSGWWYNGSPDSGAKYGRLYTWSQLMDGSGSSATGPSGVQGLCPTGWHVPSDSEWNTLMTAVGGRDSAGKKLKSTSLWNGNCSGADDYGFRALPGGIVVSGTFSDVGLYGNWWSSTEISESISWFSAWSRLMHCNDAYVSRNYHGKTFGFSARCVQGAALEQPSDAPAGMKPIPAGTFMMGSPTTEIGRYDDETQHSVTLSAFYMDSTHVTQSQYETVLGVNPSLFKDCGATCPVEQVTWFDGVLYCNARSKRDGLDTVYTYTAVSGTYGNGVSSLTGIEADLSKSGYRLPTEAQWEYAARGGTTTAYYWGDSANADTVSRYAWSSNSSGYTLKPVALKPANPFGLYDMAGNAWQWTHDWYGTYPIAEQTDPEGPPSGSYRVSRGGGWLLDAPFLRSADRSSSSPDGRATTLSFRTVRPFP